MGVYQLHDIMPTILNNHFFEMKGDVGMSGHEKEREQEHAYTKTESHS